MDYEQKYKEALGWMQSVYPTMNGANKEDAEHFFPELKGSDDEDVRQAMIDFFKSERENGIDVLHFGVNIEKMIAWLEKQGTPAKLSEEEQNKFAKGVLTSCALSFIDYLDAHKYKGKMCVSSGECEDIENAFHNAMWDRLHRYYCKYIEKQGEQNLGTDFSDLITWKYIVDAVWTEKEGIGQYLDSPFTEEVAKKLQKRFGNIEQKPADKFHEGDWVVDKKGHISKIMRVDNDFNHITYACRPIEENSRDWASYSENYIRLWDISDAKDGDVLYSNCLRILWIFKGRDTVYCGCNLNYNDGAFSGEGHIETPTDAIPATKEQRDILFKKMNEAGYEWDAEKKELKEIEKRLDWSEEDEKCIDELIKFFDSMKDCLAVEERHQENRRWLKFLKSLKGTNIMQQLQEWSIEDNIRLQEAIRIVQNYHNNIKDEYLFATSGWCLGWLKFLKDRVQPQPQWKPTEEQMYNLSEAAHYNCAFFDMEILKGLYDDLKQL